MGGSGSKAQAFQEYQHRYQTVVLHKPPIWTEFAGLCGAHTQKAINDRFKNKYYGRVGEFEGYILSVDAGKGKLIMRMNPSESAKGDVKLRFPKGFKFGPDHQKGKFFQFTAIFSEIQPKNHRYHVLQYVPLVSRSTFTDKFVDVTWLEYLLDCSRPARNEYEHYFNEHFKGRMVTWQGKLVKSSLLSDNFTLKMNPTQGRFSDVTVQIPKMVPVPPMKRGWAVQVTGNLVKLGGRVDNHVIIGSRIEAAKKASDLTPYTPHPPDTVPDAAMTEQHWAQRIELAREQQMRIKRDIQAKESAILANAGLAPRPIVMPDDGTPESIATAPAGLGDAIALPGPAPVIYEEEEKEAPLVAPAPASAMTAIPDPVAPPIPSLSEVWTAPEQTRPNLDLNALRASGFDVDLTEEEPEKEPARPAIGYGAFSADVDADLTRAIEAQTQKQEEEEDVPVAPVEEPDAALPTHDDIPDPIAAPARQTYIPTPAPTCEPEPEADHGPSSLDTTGPVAPTFGEPTPAPEEAALPSFAPPPFAPETQPDHTEDIEDIEEAAFTPPALPSAATPAASRTTTWTHGQLDLDALRASGFDVDLTEESEEEDEEAMLV